LAGAAGGAVLALTDITAAKRREDELRHRTLHDALTDLPNCTFFAERLDQTLQRATRPAGRPAVLFLDLDSFKTVNDGFGHAAGDALLRVVAARLRATIRAGETLARFGGDEFVVLLAEVQDPAEPAGAATRLLAALAPPFAWQGHAIRIGTSVGVALGARGMTDAEALLRAADAALYQAKARGRGRFVVVTPGSVEAGARGDARGERLHAAPIPAEFERAAP